LSGKMLFIMMLFLSSFAQASRAPVVAITSPENGSAYKTGSNITITASASESNGTIREVYFFDRTYYLGSTTFSPYTYTWTNVPDGTYSLTVEATDSNGATLISAPITITVSSTASLTTTPLNKTSIGRVKEMRMQLTSPEFEHNKFIPKKFTCLGEDASPTLNIKDVPKGAQSLVLIVDDPDAPGGTWVHWVVYGIPVIAVIKEGSVPGIQGINDFKKVNYGGPCPPSGTHRYFFKLYALGTKLDLPQGKTKAQIEKAMEGHILEKNELIGLFKR